MRVLGRNRSRNVTTALRTLNKARWLRAPTHASATNSAHTSVRGMRRGWARRLLKPLLAAGVKKREDKNSRSLSVGTTTKNN